MSQDFTWHLKSGTESKLSLYRLRDNYLRFYLKYIEPNKRKIAKGGMKLLPEWQSAMGLQFENLVLANRRSVQDILDIEPADITYDNPYFQKKTKEHRGCQIDYMIQTRFGTCYLCEVKFSQKAIGMSVIDEVKKKMRRLASPKHLSLRPVLIHVGEVSEDVLESGFFSFIIDFSSLLAAPQP